jgi:cell division protein FtsA
MKDIKAVFDIGNDFIKATVFANDNEKEIVLAKQMEPNQWMRKGKILDSEAFVQTINEIIENFVKKLWGDFIDEIFVSVSHPEARIQRIQEQKRIMKDSIESDDVEHLSRVIADVANQDNQQTVKIVPVYWTIDETKKEKDPIGMQGKKLELTADVFMLPKNFYNGLLDAFERIGMNVADIIPNILWAAEVVLDYDHKDLWTVLIDIGKNQTSYVIYEEGYALWYGVIPLGGEDVTKDISIWLQVDIKEAEHIKKTNGIIVIEWENITQNSSMDIHFLSDIISARYEEIFEKINKHLEKLDRDGRLPGWVFLIGGWSKMTNIDLLAKNTFKLATFFGKDIQNSMGELSTNIQLLNVLWAYVRGSKFWERRKWKFNINFDIIGKFGKRVKDLF